VITGAAQPGMGRRSMRIVAALVGVLVPTLAACSSGSPITPVTVTVTPTAGGNVETDLTFFAATSPWNTRIDSAETDPNSATMIAAASERLGAVEAGQFGKNVSTQYRKVADTHLFINSVAWTVPVVSGGVPTTITCRQTRCGDTKKTMQLTIPSDADPDPRYDGWFTVMDPANKVAYDLWRARRETDGSISYQYARMWQLDGTGFGQPGTQSARGSGLPLFAGLITASELQNGLINHALAISIPGPSQKYFVSPASATDGNGPANSLPEGARIRLKANISLPKPRDPTTGKLIQLKAQQQRTADAIAAALRTYGAIVVDRAAVPSMYAQRGISTTLLSPSELQGLSLDDFEVVTLGKKYTYPLVATSVAAATDAASPSASAGSAS
jgi:hypothetical protein